MIYMAKLENLILTFKCDKPCDAANFPYIQMMFSWMCFSTVMKDSKGKCTARGSSFPDQTADQLVFHPFQVSRLPLNGRILNPEFEAVQIFFSSTRICVTKKLAE